ncbi:hypothetical protein [Lentzea cavernae]|uniref:HEAT repeat-containing protein n=1 Tax=Lentzea cavernae TaxID=2020703 RepID=A0ABQ3MI26_9PSEU|nr:hypothetical protein [Lentzea cavernae]GHH45183.1 hypothetical protein GCM10017774_46020 [Lentzea cavernae]
MSRLEEVRAALGGWRGISETEALGGIVFEWDGDPVAAVVDDELVVRVEGGGWATATGALEELLDHSAEVVIDECVVRWHGELRAGGIPAFQAMLALVRHDPEREQLQRILLGITRGADRDLAQLAVTCLGHVGRIDREVLPEVVPRLRELLGDPQLGGRAEDALGDIRQFVQRPRQKRTSGPPEKYS